ncbi:MAG: hypothetical protein N2749_06805 [Clostridia bacterium]|nr:hypothetical protein [Clostridia bacterium]
MEQKELYKIVSKYFSNEINYMNVYGDIKQEEIVKMFKSLYSYERPDFFSIYDNKLIGIEHFEFDSYKKNTKGSDYRKKEALINKEVDKANKQLKVNNDMIMLHNEIVNTSSAESYINNLYTVFNSHYEKIAEYENNFKTDVNFKNMEIEIWFFIEDVTPLGNFYINDNDKICFFDIIHIKQFIELLAKSPNVKGIIGTSFNGKEDKISIIKNNSETLKVLKSECVDIETKKLQAFNPQLLDYTLIIPKK